MKNTLLAIASIILPMALGGCLGISSECQEPEPVQMASLLETPREFHDECVTTTGFISGLEGMVAYDNEFLFWGSGGTTYTYTFNETPHVDSRSMSLSVDDEEMEANITREITVTGRFRFIEDYLEWDPERANLLVLKDHHY